MWLLFEFRKQYVSIKNYWRHSVTFIVFVNPKNNTKEVYMWQCFFCQLGIALSLTLWVVIKINRCTCCLVILIVNSYFLCTLLCLGIYIRINNSPVKNVKCLVLSVNREQSFYALVLTLWHVGKVFFVFKLDNSGY